MKVEIVRVVLDGRCWLPVTTISSIPLELFPIESRKERTDTSIEGIVHPAVPMDIDKGLAVEGQLVKTSNHPSSTAILSALLRGLYKYLGPTLSTVECADNITSLGVGIVALQVRGNDKLRVRLLGWEWEETELTGALSARCATAECVFRRDVLCDFELVCKGFAVTRHVDRHAGRIRAGRWIDEIWQSRQLGCAPATATIPVFPDGIEIWTLRMHIYICGQAWIAPISFSC